jgi:diguanylate cyclase (GGDEF)-like protein
MSPVVEKRILLSSQLADRAVLESLLRGDRWLPLFYKTADELAGMLGIAPATAVVVLAAGREAEAEAALRAARTLCPDSFIAVIGGGSDFADAVIREACTPQEVLTTVQVGARLRDARASESVLRGRFHALEQETLAQTTRIRDLESACDTLQKWARSAQEVSVRDELTGLYNRRHFLQAAEAEIERTRRDGARFALAMVDIDHFKRFNDTYGHVAGDDMLRMFARMLLSNLRRMDTVARYGGEEFIMLMPETREAGGPPFEPERWMDRLRQAIEREPSLRGSRSGRPVTVSAGIVRYPADGKTVTDLILEADARLFRAKEGGRNRVVAEKAEG